MTCSHTITQGRDGEKGSWCVACGEKVYAVDDRECKDCDFARKLLGGWICHRHLMAIAPSMNVTFKISEGSCWTPSNAGYATKPNYGVKNERVPQDTNGFQTRHGAQW